MTVEVPDTESAGAALGAVVPHSPIPEYYTTAEQRRSFLTTIFDATAADYDKVERWLSFGSGRWYRRSALLRAGLKPGHDMADVAVGTGLVAGEAITVLGTKDRIVGIDPSVGMMEQARERLGIRTVLGTAESLPFPPGSFDFVSMGYALRHVDDLGRAFREFRRVLRPGGRVCVLEITRPRSAAGRMMLKAYLGLLSRVIGRVTRLAPRTPELWGYYWETIERCVPPATVLQTLHDSGFRDVARRTSLGIFSEYTATAP